nr:retrotransposon protein, putative, Ty1-copia subclass [Tanacetum cinerariifolium]
ICILLYVDDMLIACKSKFEIKYTKRLLRKEFDMKELGPARKILENSEKYRVDNGKLVYVPLGAHFKVLANPCKNHWEAVKWILKYLKGTTDVGLVYGRDQGKHVDINSFVDADYAKDPNKGRSIIGYVFMVHGCVVSWKVALHHVVTLSTTEAKYMVLTKAVKESIWLKGLLIELGVNLRRKRRKRRRRQQGR